MKHFFAVFCLLAAICFCSYGVYEYAVNVAYWDEVPFAYELNNSQSFGFYWQSYNEHRIIFSKLLMNIGSPIVQIYMSYLIYLAMACQLFRVVRFAIGSLWFLPILFVPLFSDINVINLLWGFASQVHLMILFALIAIEFGFIRNKSGFDKFAFIAFLALSAFSMSIVFALGIICAYAATKSLPNKKEMSLAGLGIAVLFFWKHGMVPQSAKIDFYYAANVFGSFFSGFDFFSFFQFIVCVSVIIAVFKAFIDHKDWENKNIMALYAVLCGVALSVIGIGMNRSDQPLMHRHAEIVIISIPVVLALLYRVKSVFMLEILIIVIGYSAHFQYDAFEQIRQNRLKGIQCIADYKLGKNKGDCPTLFPRNMAKFIR